MHVDAVEGRDAEYGGVHDILGFSFHLGAKQLGDSCSVYVVAEEADLREKLLNLTAGVAWSMYVDAQETGAEGEASVCDSWGILCLHYVMVCIRMPDSWACRA